MQRAPIKLSQEFLAKYKDKNPFNNPLSEFVYLRTYSRWLDDQKRRETWIETCLRTVEYSFSLYSGHKTHAELLKRAEQMFDDFFWINQLPSGRTLWVGGTEIVKSVPSANYNCSFTVIDKLKAFHDLFYLLMVGCGVGFSVEKQYVDQLPLFKKGIEVAIKDYEWCGCPAAPELTEVNYTENQYDKYAFTATMTIGDSKEGWAGGLLEFLEIHTNPEVDVINVDGDYIRPQGTRLKRFGGKASGPEPYFAMLNKIVKVINNAPEEKPGWVRLRPIDVLDICNVIGQNVVAGGVRRTAEIALMDADDKEMLHAKDNYWLSPDTQHRAMSNNSVMFWEKPSLDYLLELKESIANAYEPGFVNAFAASLRRPNFAGFNPCVEILLAPDGFCNLTTIFVTACLKAIKNGQAIDMDMLKRLIRQGVQHTMHITNVRIELDGWREVQWRDRLLGVNPTGFEDAIDAAFSGEHWDETHGYDNRVVNVILNGRETKLTVDAVKVFLNHEAKKEADEYAFELRIPRPLLVTTVQPGGTLSQLRVCSSGFHKSFAPFYIRRVRINSFDALAKMVKQLGYKVYPEVFQGWNKIGQEFVPYIKSVTGKDPHVDNMTSKDFDLLDPYAQDEVLKQADTWVVEFAVKTPATTSAADEGAIEQFERYLSYQTYWTDHNTSATIQVGEGEWEPLFERIHQDWDKYIGVSFQNKSNDKYDLAPYEAITEEEYDERIKLCVPMDVELLNQIENGVNSADDALDAACNTGACPAR
jgi:ribonucleoside-diphosphate reductase alpha chain/ribonucleoside-triphosphate reductase